jgi:hypothetical protein
MEVVWGLAHYQAVASLKGLQNVLVSAPQHQDSKGESSACQGRSHTLTAVVTCKRSNADLRLTASSFALNHFHKQGHCLDLDILLVELLLVLMNVVS